MALFSHGVADMRPAVAGTFEESPMHPNLSHTPPALGTWSCARKSPKSTPRLDEAGSDQATGSHGQEQDAS